jgi:hypothetical protein
LLIWDLTYIKEREKKKLTGERDSGEAVLMVDGGGAPVVPGGEEDADMMQNWTVNSGVWSVTTNASYSNGVAAGDGAASGLVDDGTLVVSSYVLEQF